MTFPFLQFGLFRFLRLVTTTVAASWMSSPMSWSPDGEWLSYTVVTTVDQEDLRPGWLFVSSTAETEPAAAPGNLARAGVASMPIYRIWATQRDRQSSVLIEESHDPLTAPAWSPRGKSVAFGRFVPQSLEPAQSAHGRYEVVVQDGLDRKQVLWATADFDLDASSRAALPYLSCSWSPDGLYLAVPVPGELPSFEIVRTDTKKRVAVIDRASFPVWSPDGSKCAFVRRENNSNRLLHIERRGSGFSEPRLVATIGPIPTTPFWTSDSRSIFAVAERIPTRTHELEIVRFVLDPSESIRVLPLVPEPARRGAAIRGLAIDIDREAERCFFAVDLEGRDTYDVVWCLPRDRGTIHKRFPPLDVSQRVVGVSISPDGQLVAMRFGSPRGLTPPVIYDSETEQTHLLIADIDARDAWLGELAGTARRILIGSLPPPMVDGQVAQRPTLLPLPDELPAHDNTGLRLSRLARFGSALSSASVQPTELARRSRARSTELEARLFFDYLRGDYPAAAVDLENLEGVVTDRKERLALLSLRAQILWGRGERSEARSVIDFLVSSGGAERWLVEDTPLGPILSPTVSPQHVWAQYLSLRAAKKMVPTSPFDAEGPDDHFDPRFPLPGGARLFERGGEPIPFAPFAPVREIP